MIHVWEQKFNYTNLFGLKAYFDKYKLIKIFQKSKLNKILNVTKNKIM